MFQHQVAPYTLIRGVLFKMGADDKLRRCLEKGERKQVIAALHSGPSGGHFAAITTVNRIRTTGYWWPYLIRDVKAYVRKCDQCQRTGAHPFGIIGHSHLSSLLLHSRSGGSTLLGLSIRSAPGRRSISFWRRIMLPSGWKLGQQ